MARKYLTGALQNPDELRWLIDLFKREGVKSYLEIGSRFGGSLWSVATSLPKGSRVVSVDLPSGNDTRAELEYCIADLKSAGYDARMIFGHSAYVDIIDRAAKLGPYDACLIDADHSLSAIKRDWTNYSPMCRIVAFHDIAWKRDPGWSGTRIEVPEFWNSIKDRFRHDEIMVCPSGKNNGIGVLWT